MSNRSAWVAVLLVAVLAGGPGAFRVWAAEPESDPFAKNPAAKAKPKPPKPAEKKAAARPKVPLRYGEKAVMEAVAESTTMEFVETPLVDVLAYLQNKHRIHVRLDKHALDDVGIGTDTPITFSISGVPLHAALDLMLRDLDLTWTIRAGMLLITTPEEAESKLIARTYEVTDLVLPVHGKPYDSKRLPTVADDSRNDLWALPQGSFSGMGGMGGGGAGTKPGTGGMGGGGMFQIIGPLSYPPSPYPSNLSGADFDSLIDMITSTIAPNTWDQVGGPGSIAPFPGSCSLVITQTLEVHGKIEALLDELRVRRRGVPTVVIDARWLLLDSDSLGPLMAGAARGAGRLAVDAKMLDVLARTVPGARGRIACLSGTRTHLVAGDRRSQITTAIPVVGSGIGYQPVITIPNVGVLLQVRPVVDSGSPTVLLDVQSTVTRWGDQPASVPVGGESPEAVVDEFGDRSEKTRVPAGSASARVDRPNIAAHEVAATLRVPLDQPVLVGGLTLDPTRKTAGEQAPGERRQLYLFVETSVVQPPRPARATSAPARGRAARRKR